MTHVLYLVNKCEEFSLESQLKFFIHVLSGKHYLGQKNNIISRIEITAVKEELELDICEKKMLLQL